MKKKVLYKLMTLLFGLVLAFAIGACGDGAGSGDTGGNGDLTLSGTITISAPSSEAGATLTAVYSGTENVLYQWKVDNTNLGTAKTQVASQAGSYTVTVSLTGYKSKTSLPVNVTAGTGKFNFPANVKIKYELSTTMGEWTVVKIGEEGYGLEDRYYVQQYIHTFVKAENGGLEVYERMVSPLLGRDTLWEKKNLSAKTELEKEKRIANLLGFMYYQDNFSEAVPTGKKETIAGVETAEYLRSTGLISEYYYIDPVTKLQFKNVTKLNEVTTGEWRVTLWDTTVTDFSSVGINLP
jgi:hypothetical protein